MEKRPVAKDAEVLMKEAGITQEQVDAAHSTESVFLYYFINGRSVHVEIIAPNLVETLLHLPTAEQSKLIAVVLNLVPKVGDCEVITEDHSNGKKPRGARIIRMRGEHEGDISLLITR